MFENIIKLFKKGSKTEALGPSSKETAKERLHLVLMQDRANVSADFLDLMRLEIIEVIKKYIDIDEKSMDVRLTNQTNDDGTQGAPALYANIPILSIKDNKDEKTEEKNRVIRSVDTIKIEFKNKDLPKENDIKEKNEVVSDEKTKEKNVQQEIVKEKSEENDKTEVVHNKEKNSDEINVKNNNTDEKIKVQTQNTIKTNNKKKNKKSKQKVSK